MRRILALSILFLIFSTVAFIDAYTLSLPLDLQSTEAEQDLQPVNLASVVQNRPQPCSGENPPLNMVNKRQIPDCVAGNCEASDYELQEFPSDNQPAKLSYPFGNQEDSLKLPVKLDALSSEQNNDLGDFTLNDATTNLFSSSSNEQNTPGQAGSSFSDIRTDDTGDSLFEIAAKQKDPGPTVEQDPTTGFVLI